MKKQEVICQFPDVDLILVTVHMLAWDYLRHRKMVGKFFEFCRHLNWHGNDMSYVTSYFKKKSLYKEVGDNSRKGSVRSTTFSVILVVKLHR